MTPAFTRNWKREKKLIVLMTDLKTAFLNFFYFSFFCWLPHDINHASRSSKKKKKKLKLSSIPDTISLFSLYWGSLLIKERSKNVSP
jgi:hypothetical protein